MKNFVVKNKFLIVVFVLFVGLTSFYYQIVEVRASKLNGFKIVIDAGHGGRDGGSVGVNGTIEKQINLEYAYLLKDKLVDNGFTVEMTRKTDDGLYSATDKNKKQSDMNERFKIIKRSNPNLVVSIHMNSFTSSSAKGAMTYFRKGDSASERCADLIQKSLHTYCGAKQTLGKVGDYYMLNCSYYTAVLVECGFLSNPDEETMLNSDEYKSRVIDSIFKGILLYFGNAEI